MRYDNFTPEDEKAFIEFTKGNVAAAFIYSQNVAAGGKLIRYDENDRSVRTIAMSGTVMVPSLFFSKFLKVVHNGKTLEFSEKKLIYTPGLKKYEINGVTGEFSVAPIEKRGIDYLPALEVARLLGFCAELFYENRFVVVGDEAHINELKNNPTLVSAGTYAIFGNYDASKFTPADYKMAREKWCLRLVGNKELNNLDNPLVVNIIKQVEEKCENALNTMNRGEDPVILWGDKAPTESDELSKQYGQIRNMALGYATYGNKFYHSDELAQDIKFAMDWMYEHMYGEAEIACNGWRDPHAFNWWYWYVGAPEPITDIIFMLEDRFTMADKKKYLKCFEWIYTWMSTTDASTMTRICVCTKVGLALEDPKYLNKEYEDFDKRLVLNETGGGPHVDYVDFTHRFPYNMAYGLLNLDRVLRVASILSGTPLEFSNPQQYMQFMLAKYMFEPAMYKGQGFVMFMGRSNAGREINSALSAMSNILPMIGVYGDDEDAYIKKMIKRNSSSPEFSKMLKERASLYDIALYESILNDDSIPYDNDYEYAHAWFTGDRAAQHRNDYAIGIAMSSKREFTYESINNANHTGWYTGDGALYLYTNYDRHQYDGDNFITKNVNVAYRYPGTTEDIRERVPRAINGTKAWYPSKAFAGAIQHKDKYIAATMDFEAMHFEGPEEDFVDTGYGGALAVHFNDLVAKKSWFCFDNEILCLGAGINSTMDSEVNTTLEHRRIMNDDKYAIKYKADGKLTEFPRAEHNVQLKNPDWFMIEGHAGFLLPEDSNVYLGRYVCKEANEQPFFEARIEHGKNPTDATYSYIIIPYATEEQLDAYCKSPDVEIISNTAALQAAREKNIGMTAMVFHEAGKCEYISVNKPCMVVLTEEKGELEIGVTDPTHELEELKVTVSAKLELIEANPKMSVSVGNEKTDISIDVKLANGRPFRAKFKIV